MTEGGFLDYRRSGVFREGGVDSGSVAYSCQKRGLYSCREGQILGVSHIVAERGYILGCCL